MALTYTSSIELGFKAPDFELPDTVSGTSKTLADVKGTKATLVVFMCNHCPYVIHVIEQIVQIANEYAGKGVATVAISSNDVLNYPADAPEKMTLFAKKYGFTFPYLYDETQEVARSYDAACTPDFSIFDADLNCVYRGRLDDSSPGKSIAVTGKDLRQALDAVVAGRKPDAVQQPSMGCGIKWKQ